jgi:hypothetical protein
MAQSWVVLAITLSGHGLKIVEFQSSLNLARKLVEGVVDETVAPVHIQLRADGVVIEQRERRVDEVGNSGFREVDVHGMFRSDGTSTGWARSGVQRASK